jgi:hypothetical protein
MVNQYWVSHFAERRKDQLIKIPHDYTIHKDFMLLAGQGEIRNAFSQLHALYAQISEDIITSPEEFGMPLYAKDEYRNFSQQCRDSEQAASRPFMLMALLFSCSDDCAGSIVVSIERFKSIKPRPANSRSFSEKVTNAQFLFKKLTEYGFVFEGLKNYKTSNQDIVIHYPDKPLLLRLWKMLADKAFNIDQISGFISCSYRLLQDDMHTKAYSDFEWLIDTFPLQEEKDFVCKMDEMLVSKGLLRG